MAYQMSGLCCGWRTNQFKHPLKGRDFPFQQKGCTFTGTLSQSTVSQRLNGNKDYGLLGCNAICFGSRYQTAHHNIPKDIFIFITVRTPNPHLSGKFIQNRSQNSLYPKQSISSSSWIKTRLNTYPSICYYALLALMVTEGSDVMFTITFMKIHQYFFGPQTYTHAMSQQTSGMLINFQYI